MKTKTLHFRAVSITRTKGHNAVAACAYRSGQNLTDDKTDAVHRYGNRSGIINTQIFTPEAAPDWMQDEDQQRSWQRFGNEIEKKEDGHNRRASAELAKDFQVAAPRELNHEQNWALAQRFSKTLNDKGLPVAAAFHEEDASDGGKNPHFHFFVPMRTVDEDGFGKKYRGLSGTSLPGKENPEFKELRRTYYQHVNDALADAGIEGVYYDPEKQDKEPGIHLGKEAAAMERKGKKTNLGTKNQQIGFENKVQPYADAIEDSEEPWAFQPPATGKDWESKQAEWHMRRAVAHAERKATQRAQVSTPTPASSRVDHAVHEARENAVHRWRQKETERRETTKDDHLERA
jgi:hypothetical protein